MPRCSSRKSPYSGCTARKTISCFSRGVGVAVTGRYGSGGGGTILLGEFARINASTSIPPPSVSRARSSSARGGGGFTGGTFAASTAGVSGASSGPSSGSSESSSANSSATPPAGLLAANQLAGGGGSSTTTPIPCSVTSIFVSRFCSASIVGPSINRRRITSRIGSTAGFASSRNASHRHERFPRLASFAGGAVCSFVN